MPRPAVLQRPKVSVFIATSLDGFIARPDGSIDWLEAANAAIPSGEDCGYGEFMAGVDVLVMGRATYEQVLKFGAWPYGQKPVVVLSRRSIAFPDHVPGHVRHSSAAPQELCEELALNGARHVYIDGGLTIQRFLAAGLVDELTITIIPILLGAGRPLFGPVAGDVPLRSLSARAYDFGFVQLHYAVVQPD